MSNAFTPGPTPNTVRAADGQVLTAPEGWALLPPGDAGRQRDRGQDEAHPGRTSGRGCGDRLDAPPDDRLRRHGDPQGQGEAARGPPATRCSVAGVASPLPSWGVGAGGV